MRGGAGAYGERAGGVAGSIATLADLRRTRGSQRIGGVQQVSCLANEWGRTQLDSTERWPDLRH